MSAAGSFPPDCPVSPLGIENDAKLGYLCHYLDARGKPVILHVDRGHGRLSLLALFGGDQEWLTEHFPQWSRPRYERIGNAMRLSEPSEVVGFDQAEAARALVEECCRLSDPARKGPAQ